MLTGRVHRLLYPLVDQLGEAYRGGKRCILIVPEQFTLEAELTLVERLKLPGFFDIEVLSPTRLRTRIFERADAPERVLIDERGKQMVLGELLFGMKENLSFYRAAAELPGFAQRMGALLSDFKRGEVTPAQVQAMSAAAKNRALSQKLADAAAIYAAYEERLEGRFVDGEDMHRAMLARMAPSKLLQGAAVYVYGFDMITPQFAGELTAIAGIADALTVALETDVTSCPDAGIYSAVNKSLARLRTMLEAAQRPYLQTDVEGELDAPQSIRHLEKQLFAVPLKPQRGEVKGLRLLSAATPYAEVHEVASRLRLLAAKRNMPFHAAAVVYAQGETYAPLIREIFPLYGIPFHIDEKRPAAHHPLIRFLLSALRSATSGYRTRDVMDCARTGYAGLNQEECDLIDQYAVAYGLRGGLWKQPLRYGDEETLAILEPLRERLISPLAALQTALSRAKGADATIRAIMDYLSATDAAKTLEDDRERLMEAGLASQAMDSTQVWNRLMEVLDQLHTLLGDRHTRAQVLLRMFEAGLLATELGQLPQAPEAVLCGAMGHVRTGQVDALFLLGANDGMIASGSDGLLNERERAEAMAQGDVYLGMSDRERLELSRLDVLKILCRPKRVLQVSYAMASQQGAALRPSSVISRLVRVFPDLPTEGGALRDESQALLSAPGAALSGIAAQLRRAYEEGAQTLDKGWQSAYAYLYRDEEFSEALRRVVQTIYEKKAPAHLRVATAQDLYGRKTLSVSRIERFAACPYQHFVMYGLRPEKQMVYGTQRSEAGEIYHQAVDEYTAKAMALPAWPQITREQSDALMAQVCRPLLDKWGQTALGESARGKAIARRMKRTAQRAGWALTTQMQSSGFRPDRTEAVFGKGNIPPVQVELPSGERLYLQGRIDRIDLHDCDQSVYLRVVDYKSGRKEIDATEVYWGLQLQLLIYLQAALSLYPGAKGAGFFYCRIEDPMVRTDSRIVEEVEKKIAKELRLKGVSLGDVDIIRAQGSEIEEAMLKRDGTLLSRAQAVDEEQMTQLVAYATHIVGQLSTRMGEGEIAVAPAEKEQWRACQYCDYRDICGFDLTNGSRTRVLAKKTFEDIFAHMAERKEEKTQ